MPKNKYISFVNSHWFLSVYFYVIQFSYNLYCLLTVLYLILNLKFRYLPSFSSSSLFRCREYIQITRSLKCIRHSSYSIPVILVAQCIRIIEEILIAGLYRAGDGLRVSVRSDPRGSLDRLLKLTRVDTAWLAAVRKKVEKRVARRLSRLRVSNEISLYLARTGSRLARR